MNGKCHSSFITFLVVLTYFLPKKYAIAGNIYCMSEEKIK